MRICFKIRYSNILFRNVLRFFAKKGQNLNIVSFDQISGGISGGNFSVNFSIKTQLNHFLFSQINEGEIIEETSWVVLIYY